MRAWAWVGLAMGLVLSSPAFPKARDLAPLRALLAEPDTEIAQAKLAIDRHIDPSVDPAAVERQLADLLARVKARLPPNASRAARLDALLSTLYAPGEWNQHRPFRYDLRDPFGREVRNKLLSTYLARREGNCVSMPILVLILGRRLGLPMTLATAPGHLLVKFRDSDGRWRNIEATAGGFKSDASYERELRISPKARANALYLRPLPPREAIGAMLATAMEHAGATGRQNERIALAELALSVNPRDVVAMAHQGAAYYLLLQERYVRKYPNPADIPPALHADFRRLGARNLAWYARAEALGWTPPTQAGDADYLRTIERERARRTSE